MSATETTAPATAAATAPATGAKTPAKGTKAAPKRAARGAKAGTKAGTKPAAAKPATARAKAAAKTVTPVETPAPAVVVEQQAPADPIARIRATAFAQMVEVAQRGFARDLPPEAIENGVRAARSFWSLDGFGTETVAHMCAAVFDDQPTGDAEVEEARRADALKVLMELERIALHAAVATRAARDEEAFGGVPDEAVAQVRKLTGVGEQAARRGLLMTLAQWQGAGVAASAYDRIARALFGSTGRGQRRVAWQVMSRVVAGA
jgi:hypothetical protein